MFSVPTLTQYIGYAPDNSVFVPASVSLYLARLRDVIARLGRCESLWDASGLAENRFYSVKVTFFARWVWAASKGRGFLVALAKISSTTQLWEHSLLEASSIAVTILALEKLPPNRGSFPLPRQLLGSEALTR